MNEEEIIDYLKNCLNDEFNFKHATRQKDKQAIQGLLDLYNKEKEKNKELEKYKKYYENEKVVWNRKDYINKDKIRDKIKELEKFSDKFYEHNMLKDVTIKQNEIQILKKLLEERN